MKPLSRDDDDPRDDPPTWWDDAEAFVVLREKGIGETAGAYRDRTGNDPPGQGDKPPAQQRGVIHEQGDELPEDLVTPRFYHTHRQGIAALNANGERLDGPLAGEPREWADTALRSWRQNQGFRREERSVYVCQDCGKEFGTADALNGHKQVHRVEAPDESGSEAAGDASDGDGESNSPSDDPDAVRDATDGESRDGPTTETMADRMTDGGETTTASREPSGHTVGSGLSPDDVADIDDSTVRQLAGVLVDGDMTDMGIDRIRVELRAALGDDDHNTGGA